MTAISSTEQAADVAALLRARNPLIWIVTREEARVEAYLFEAAASAGYVARCWDVGQGVTDLAGKALPIASADPAEILALIGQRARAGEERGVWIMRDLAPWLAGPIGISAQQASADIGHYEKIAAANLRYDRAEKAYIRTDDFAPAFIGETIERYLLQLVAIENRWMRPGDTWFDAIPPIEALARASTGGE